MDRNNIYFYDDAGHEVAGVPFGGSTLLQNHQCGVHPWESTLTPAAAGGATATLTLSMVFLGAYTGAKPIWMSASNGVTSAWASTGTYTVSDQWPSVGTFTMPPSAWNQTFTFHYSDPDGAADFANVQVQINNGFDPYYYCFLVVDSGGRIYLADDTTGATMDPIVAGQAGNAHNRYCSVDSGGSLLTLEGANGWKLDLAMSFTPAYSGPRNVSSIAIDRALLNGGWSGLGAYVVPSTGTTYTISGQVTASGIGMSGASVGLSGTQYAIATTDSNGNYVFNGLPAGGSYTLSVWKSGYTFYPGTAGIANLTANWTAPILMAVMPDFTINSSATTATMIVGGPAAHYPLTVTPVNGFTGTVTFTPAGLPTGTTLSPASISVTGTLPISVDLTVSPPANVPPVTSAFSVTASAAPLPSHVLSGLALVVQDFQIVITPPIQVTNYSGNAWNPAALLYQISATGVNGFNGTINLTLTNQGQVPCASSYSAGSTTLTVAAQVSYTLNMAPGCTANPNSFPVVSIDSQSGGVHRYNGAGVGLNQSAPESISTPSISIGPSSGTVGTSYTYTASGGVSSFGHSVEYQFNWGDGSSSGWLSTPVATHAWSAATTYTVFVQARCALDHNVISSVSNAYSVNLTGAVMYTLSGQVQQPNGAGIGETILAVRDSQNALVTAVTSDDSGNYSIPLPAGMYTVTASSPYGIFNPASQMYNLTSHLPGQNRRLLTMLQAPDEDPPYYGDSRNYYNIPNSGVPQTKPFWYLGSDDNARNTSSCWVSGPTEGVTAQFNYPTDAEVAQYGPRYFTITFAAQPTAALGNRDVICRYGNQTIVGITGINVYSSCVPHITAVTVNGQATNTIIAGTKGKLGISGECLNNEEPANSTSVTVAGGNIQIPSVDSADANGIVVSYDANTFASGTQNLTVQTDRGTDFKAMFATRLLVSEVTFPASLPYNKDCPGNLSDVSNSVPAWKATNRLNNDCSASTPPPNEAVVYVGGTIMTAKVKFTLAPAPLSQVPGVRIEGSVAGVGKFIATGCTIPTASDFTVGETGCPLASFVLAGHPENTNDPADKALPTNSKLYNPMTVDWNISADGQPCTGNCSGVGSSANTVYVTLGKEGASGPTLLPTLLPLYLTAVHLAVSTDGATKKSEAFQKTWGQFAGPANVKGWDGRSLYYYRDDPSNPVGFACAKNVNDLLQATNGDGQCGSFALLLEWSLAVNGIAVHLPSSGLPAPDSIVQVAWTEVADTDPPVMVGTPPIPIYPLMIVKNWRFADPPSYSTPPYVYSMILGSSDFMVPPPSAGFGDLTNLTGIAGQNSVTPAEKVFGSHFFIKVDPSLLAGTGLAGPYFDPSYGVQYSGADNFEAQAISGYAQFDPLVILPSAQHYLVKKTGTTPNPIVIIP